MINVIFWNLNRKPLQHLLAALVKNYVVDVLILAENKIPKAALLAALNARRAQYRARPWDLCSKITVFTKFNARFLQPTVESDRILICRLKLPARTEILLAMAHLPSKVHFDEDSQLAECHALSERIKEAENKAGHARTILVGDLNVNPFEKGIVGTLGLHAIMAKHVAMRNSRIVQDKQYQFFYNPMWKHFGERPDSPPGSYYYDKANHTNYFWNIFDQVLIRPDLIKHFPDQELRIVTSIGGVNLLGTNGEPDKATASDHLPMFFKLDI
jgi:hypothetical protein